MTRGRWGTVLALCGLFLLIGTGVAHAGKSGPCSGSATINGVRYDHRNDTADNPIVIPEDKEGVVVSWEGSTGNPITNHNGSVSVVLGPIPIEVTDWEGANANNETTANGDYNLSDLPDFLKSVTGLYEVTAKHSGTGGTCEGDVMVLLEGNGLATPIGAGSLAGTVITAVGLLFSGRGKG